jgi:nucleoid-associated protein YgaU
VLITQATPTAIVQGEERTPTEEPSLETPGATAEPATPTPPPVEPTATAGLRTYVVQDGDTLIGIAERFAPVDVLPFTYAQQIAAASGISIDQALSVGATLILP